MTRPPSRLWTAIESVPGLTAVQSEWQRLLRTQYPEARQFLSPTAFRVETYPCPSPGGDGCPRQVVERDGGFEAICGDTPKKCIPIQLTASDLVIYEVDVARLGREISKTLGVTRFSFSTTGIHQTWGLGGYGPIAAEALPVYLTIPTGRDAFRRSVVELLMLSDGPFLLLAPTSKLAGLPTIELIRKRQSIFAALDDQLDLLPDGTLEAVKTLDAIVGPRGRTKPEGKGEAIPSNAFRRSGETWALAFQGKVVHLPDSRGLWLLSQMLHAPRQRFPASQLEALGGGRDSAVRTGSSGELLDEKAREAYRRRASEISAELEEAARFNDRGRRERLQEELETIADQLAQATGLGGRRRRATDDAQRARKAVSNSITRAIATIRRSHPELASHLGSSVRLGQFLAYEPEGDVCWSS